MDQFTTLSSLNLFTIGTVLVLLIGYAIWYFRKRDHRHPMGDDEGLHTDLDEAARRADPPRARDARQ